MDEEQSGGSAADDVPATLTIEVGGASHTVRSDDAAVTIGRESPSQILLPESGVSRTHVRIEYDEDHWSLTDTGSRNGTFVDGERVEQITVTATMVVHLGSPSGIAIRLDPQPTSPEPTAPDEELTDFLSPSVQTAVAIDAAQVEVRAIRARIDQLPDPSDRRFPREVTPLLTQLRRLDHLGTATARKTPGRVDLAAALAGIRQARAELLLLASRSPWATLGQQLGAVRHRGRMSVEEVATAAGVTVADIETLEREEQPTAGAVEALERFVTAVGDRLRTVD